MIRALNNLLKNKRLPLMIILNLCLIVFVFLEISIINQNKVAFDLWEEKRLHSERAGRILRAERANAAQKMKLEEQNNSEIDR